MGGVGDVEGWGCRLYMRRMREVASGIEADDKNQRSRGEGIREWGRC